MSQYGSYEMEGQEKIYRKDGSVSTIPYGKTLKEGLEDFFGDCYCGIRMEEGVVFHLINGKTIRVNVMDIAGVYPYDEYIGFSLEYEEEVRRDFDNEFLGYRMVRKDFMIPYDKILYIAILPHNPKTYRMG